MNGWSRPSRGLRHTLSSGSSLIGAPAALLLLVGSAVITGLPWLIGLGVITVALWLTVRARRAAALMHGLLDTMLDPHVVLRAVRDRKGRIIDFRFVEANPLACAFNQLSHEQLIGRSLLAQHPASQRTELLQAYIHVVETGEPLILDDWIYPQDVLGGSLRRYDVRAVKLGDGISQTWRDVTERSDAQRRLRLSEEGYHLLADNSIDIVLRLDDHGRISWVSPSIATLGFSASDWVDRPVTELFDPESLQVWEHQLSSISTRGSITARLQLTDRDGRSHWIESVLKTFLDNDGTANGLVLSLRLIDDRVASEHRLDQEIRSKLVEGQRLAAYAEEISSVGSWQLDHASGELEGSSQFHRCMALGEPAEPLTLLQFLAAIQADDRDRFLSTLLQASSDGRAFEEHVRVPHGDHLTRPVVIRGVTRLDARGQPQCTQGTVQDVTELEALRYELDKRQWIDPTTGLPNRAATLRQIEKLIDPADQQSLAIINLDIDDFQRLNDTFGNERCTHLLCGVSDTLRRLLHDADWLARIGSDEFLVIRAGIASSEEAKALALQLQQGLAASDLLSDELHMGIPASIGVSLWPEHASNAEGLLQAANTALMEAKRRGSRQLQLYSSGISERIQERIRMELALWRSLNNEQLSIVYQPQVNGDGQIMGAEALLRWRGADGEAIAPVKFIPLAEATGLIHPIGEWLIDSCFRQLAQWRDAGLPSVALAINLSPVQLEDPSDRLSNYVLECLQRHAIDPQMVEFELTETAIQSDPETVSRQFHALAEAGFHLVLDDFGTGYSSLEVLHRLPFRKLKIDRCFVDPLLQGGADLSIVHASLLMAQRLGLSTLAEGVSRSEQVTLLMELGCDLFQGYLFSPPVSTTEFEAMLQRGTVIPAGSEP